MAGAKIPGPLREWGDSPPWGGSGAPVGRASARPDILDRPGFDPETTARAGVRLPWNQAGKPFYADAGELLDELLAQTEQLTEFVDLQELIKRLLGPQCFVLGVVYGVGENFVVSILDLLEMIKTLLLAELYDATRRNPGWTAWRPGGIAMYLTAQLLNEYLGEEIHQAAQERDALMAEIARVFEHPGDFFGAMQDQYVEKFKRLVTLGADPSPESQFQAGRVFGEILMDVLAVIGAGAALAKVASKMPRLLKLAGKIKGRIAHRVSVGAGKAEVSVSRTGPPPKKPASPPPRKEPKVELAPTAAATAYIEELRALGLDPQQVRMGSNGKVAVIGRSMDSIRNSTKVLKDVEIFDGDMIPSAAKAEFGLLKKKYGRLTDEQLRATLMYDENLKWAKKLKEQGYTVVDLGSPAGATSSVFYEMEKAVLSSVWSAQ